MSLRAMLIAEGVNTGPTSENLVHLVDRIYECRRAARTLLGDDYSRRIALYTDLLRNVAKVRQLSDLQAAMLVARDKDLNGYTQILVLAAFVEMIEPTPSSSHSDANASPSS